MLATVALGEASIARSPVHRIRSDETGEDSIPTPKNVFEKLARKPGRSFLNPSIMPANTAASTPSGLSAALSRYGVTAETSTAPDTRAPPCRLM